MTSQEIVRAVVAESLSEPVPEGTIRDVELPKIPGRATVAIGMRRSGKTYRLYQKARELLVDGVSKRDMLIVDFEDSRLAPCGSGLIRQVVDTYEQLVPRDGSQMRYLFLDEVQNVPDWGREVRMLLKGGRYEVYVSGSSAKALSTDLATEFRGRSISCEVFPLSFREFLRHRGLEPRDEIEALANAAQISGMLEQYVRIGGFPEVQDVEARTRVRALQELVDAVVVRDVAERHKLPLGPTTAFVRKALRHSARLFSVNSIFNEMKSQQMGISKDLAYRLPEHCEDAYLLFLAGQFTTRETKRRMGLRKLYAVDPGLQMATSLASSDDFGLALEDAVYVDLRRRYGTREASVCMYRTDLGEVDFVAGDTLFEGIPRLFQVTALLDPSTVEGRATIVREETSLLAAMDDCGASEGTIIAGEVSPAYVPSDARIKVMPAWRWLLDDKD